MGSGIVQVSAQAGFSVLFVEANDELVKRGLGRLRDTLEGLTAKGKLEAKDATAFIVNRLLVPYLLDAVRVYEGGLASLDDIDQAMKLGCGYPMGPFTLLDLVGLDTAMYVAEVMFEEFREPRYAPPPLLERMCMTDHPGPKTGRGFSTYYTK